MIKYTLDDLDKIVKWAEKNHVVADDLEDFFRQTSMTSKKQRGVFSKLILQLLYESDYVESVITNLDTLKEQALAIANELVEADEETTMIRDELKFEIERMRTEEELQDLEAQREGRDRVTKPPDVEQDVWNRNFTKIENRKVNITPKSEEIARALNRAGFTKTAIARELAKQELIEKGIPADSLSKPAYVRKVKARTRTYVEVVKAVL